jgi:TRAP-type C4-dicarboxylate transport system permease large subunit
MLLIIGLYIVLGCFMDALAMVITTVPIITPIVVHLGYDPVWFGIIIVLVTETSLITPPIGVNLFVIQSIRGRGPIGDVIIGSAPFVVTMMVMIAVIFVFPALALWMPTLFYR